MQIICMCSCCDIAANTAEELDMDYITRRHAVAGVALVGAGLIAAGPVTAPELTTVRARAVALTMSWDQVFENITANAQTVSAANQDALNSLFTGLFGSSATENLQTALQAASLVGAPDDVVSAVLPHSLGGEADAVDSTTGRDDVHIFNVHQELYDGLSTSDDFHSPVDEPGYLDFVNFVSSPMSGVLIAALGPLISPLVALYNSVSAGEFADIPANVVNAFFNGATLDVGQLLPDLLSAVDDYAIEGSDGGEHIDALFFAFGGLFSPGLVRDGVGDVENGV